MKNQTRVEPNQLIQEPKEKNPHIVSARIAAKEERHKSRFEILKEAYFNGKLRSCLKKNMEPRRNSPLDA